SSGTRYVRRSRTGAATTTPGASSIAATLSGERPCSPNAATRRSARPTMSWTVRSMADSMPASVASDANRTPTPRAIPTTDSSVRPRRALRLRRASEFRPRIETGASESQLGEPADQRRGVVVLAPAQDDLVADPAIGDDEDAVGVGRGLRIVGDEHDRLVALDAGPPERVEDLRAGRVVEVAGRLVGEEQGRASDEGAGDRDALLLAGAQLVGAVVLLAGQVDERDGVADPVGDLA